MLSARLRSSTITVARWYSAPAAGAGAATPSLDQLLRASLKEAMKAKDKPKSSLFKSVLAELQNASHLLSPPPPLKTLSKAVAAREDGADIYASSKPPRKDLEDLYRWEASILRSFLPAEPEGMDPTELRGLVRSVLGELGLNPDEPVGKNLGKVIKAVTEKAEGKVLGKQMAEAVKKVGAAVTSA